MKIICWRFHIKTPFIFWDMRTWGMWKVCLQTFTNSRICHKLAHFLRNLQTSQANNSRILRIKNTKLSGYCFYMNTYIKWDFQICISVTLILHAYHNIIKSLETEFIIEEQHRLLTPLPWWNLLPTKLRIVYDITSALFKSLSRNCNFNTIVFLISFSDLSQNRAMFRNWNHLQRRKTQLNMSQTTLVIIFRQFSVFRYKFDSPQV